MLYPTQSKVCKHLNSFVSHCRYLFCLYLIVIQLRLQCVCTPWASGWVYLPAQQVCQSKISSCIWHRRCYLYTVLESTYYPIRGHGESQWLSAKRTTNTLTVLHNPCTVTELSIWGWHNAQLLHSSKLVGQSEVLGQMDCAWGKWTVLCDDRTVFWDDRTVL